jgi:hypothetical protein
MKTRAFIVLLFPLLAAAHPPSNSGTAVAVSENTVGIYGSMGVHLLSDASVVNYINQNGLASSLVPSWGTAIEFVGGVEIPVSRSWGVKVEHSYLFKSYTLYNVGASNDFHYNVQAPTLMLQYVIPGKGFFVKFSGGGGYHWGALTSPDRIAGETTYHASGLGIRGEAEGQTAFDEHLYGYIGGVIGVEELGRVTSPGGQDPPYGAVSINYITVGLRFGLMYYF